MAIKWTRVAENTSVICYPVNDLHFPTVDLILPKDVPINGIFLGYIEEEYGFRIRVQVPEYNRIFGITPKDITVNLLDTKQCFRCERHRSTGEFKRHPLIQDTSPILSEVCADCYKRVKNKIAEHDSHARKYGGAHTLKVSEWLELLKASGGKCHYCKKHVGYVPLIIEHMIPLSWKGANSKDNVVPACVSCNSSKGDRDIETWQRQSEAKKLLEKLQAHLGLSKYEVTVLAIETLAQSVGLVDVEVKP